MRAGSDVLATSRGAFLWFVYCPNTATRFACAKTIWRESFVIFIMNIAAAADPNRIQLTEKTADRIGVATSVLCAIHCALAPVLLIFLPTFGKIWAHPASHALVAIFIVPLAGFSLLKGYRKHRKRWIVVSASVGIFFVLFGATLPAFSKVDNPVSGLVNEPTNGAEPAKVEACESSCESSCEGCASEAMDEPTDTEACVDGCCPSIQVSESGETSLHIPPAAIITTLGGVFLIAAHVGNLRSGVWICSVGDCPRC